MVKAHSLLYALFISLLVALCLTGLLYITNFNAQLNQWFTFKQELIVQHYSATNYIVKKTAKSKQGVYNSSNAPSTQYNWEGYGFLQKLHIETLTLQDTLSSWFLVGAHNPFTQGLVLPFQSQWLQVTANVQVYGGLAMEAIGVKQIYVTNKKNEIDIPEIQNQVLPLKTRAYEVLQQIKNEILAYNEEFKLTPGQRIEHSFKEVPLVIKVPTSKLQQCNLIGNIILFSKDSIHIAANTQLDKVIIVAPKITIAKDFKGNAQFIATQEIAVQDNVQLYYPSAVVVIKQQDQAKIVIEENFKLDGLLAFLDPLSKHEDDLAIQTTDNTKIRGTVFCEGNLYLSGKVLGQVYAHTVSYKIQESIHYNCLGNVTIHAGAKPNRYVDFPIYTDRDLKYEIIQEVL